MEMLSRGFWLLLLCLFAIAIEAKEPNRAVVERVASLIEREYVDPALGAKISTALRSQLEQGGFDRTDSDRDLAARLTESIRAISGPGHLYVEVDKSDSVVPEDAKERDAAFERKEQERYYGAHLNFGFVKAERLSGNIGLLELSVFAPVAMGGDTAVAAMQFLANTDALIIDLRKNGGGYGEMANLISSYLFDGGTHPLSGIYSREKNATAAQHTHAFVPGARYGQTKPVYVLTSKKTFSAAEAFTYDLQALKRATVVGERSGGGANPFEYRYVGRKLVLWLETERSVNPITRSNWQTVGVAPDVAVSADEAFEAALSLAKRTLASTGTPRP